jgi:excisionase family DNA binding protein
MDSLNDWYRKVDSLSRRPRRLSAEEEQAAASRWRPWLPPEEEEEPVEVVKPPVLPNLAPSLGAVTVFETRQQAAPGFEDLTVHDELPPVQDFEAPRFEAPSFGLDAPRLSPVPPRREVLPAPAEPPVELRPPTLDLRRPAGPSSSLSAPAPPREAPAARAAAAPAVEQPPTPRPPVREQPVREPAAAPEEDAAARQRRHWDLLGEIRSQDVAQNSYKSPFRETREQLVQRLLDPPLTLEEAARLLGVCPTTVRRYTNKGLLRHFRTEGNQRRFRLSDVLEFLESRYAEIEADGRADREAEAAEEARTAKKQARAPRN